MDAWKVVTRFIPEAETRQAESMTKDTLIKRVGQLRKAGVSIHCVYEAGRTEFAFTREPIALEAECLVVRARNLEGCGRPRKNDKRDSGPGGLCWAAKLSELGILA